MGQPQAQAPRLVRDFRGQKVRMTYHRRDPSYSSTLGIADGQPGPFDRDEVAEGVLDCVVCYILPSRIHLWGIIQEDGSYVMGFLGPEDPLVLDTNLHSASRWDGKKNGTYEIERVG